MKKEFKISKAFPNIEVVVTRDSVCAADDCDAPHKKTIKMPSFLARIFHEELKNDKNTLKNLSMIIRQAV